MIYRRLVTYIACLSLLMASTSNLAMTFEEAIALGKEQGNDSVSGFEVPSLNGSSDESFTGINYTDQNGDVVTIDKADIVQGQTNNYSSFLDTNGSDSATIGSGTATHGALRTEDSALGDAYTTLRDNFDGDVNPTPDLSLDPIMTRNRQILDPANLPEDFNDCSSVTNYLSSVETVHKPDIKQCLEVPLSGFRCEVKHDVFAEFINVIDSSGRVSFSRCGSDPTCINIRLGAPNYGQISGSHSCQAHEFFITMEVLVPDAIESVVLRRMEWDDIAEARVNGDNIWDYPNNIDWRDDIGDLREGSYNLGRGCELSAPRDSSPNVDITSYFKENAVVDLSHRVGIGDAGFGASWWRLTVDPSLIPVLDNYYPSNCVDEINRIQAMDPPPSYCSVSMGCTETINPSHTCAVNSLWCPPLEWLDPSPMAPTIEKSCKTAFVDVDCPFGGGSGADHCVIASDGTEQCLEAGGVPANTCEVYQDDPGCAYVGRECVEQGTLPSGECIAYQQIYDCGYSVDVPTTEAETTFDCPGPVRCMGDDCIDDMSTSSDQFVQAVAGFQTAQMLDQYGSCDASGCTLFNGEAYECKTAVSYSTGGEMHDCCFDPVKPDNFGSFVKATTHAAVLDYTLNNSAAYDAIASGGQMLTDAAYNAYDGVTSYFTGGGECVLDAGAEASSVVMQGIMEGTQAALNWVYEGLGDAIITTSTAPGGGLVLNPAIAGPLGAVMAVYSAYTLTKLAVSLIYKCEDEEFELVSKRGLQSCHYLGIYCETELPPGHEYYTGTLIEDCLLTQTSFCCYDGPLARILMEQFRNQGIGDWGTATYPNCDGITLDQLDDIDWELVNLDEWKAIIVEEGLIQDPSSINIDVLTGEGAGYDYNPLLGPPKDEGYDDGEADTLNALDSLNEKAELIDPEQVLDDATEDLQNSVIW